MRRTRATQRRVLMGRGSATAAGLGLALAFPAAATAQTAAATAAARRELAPTGALRVGLLTTTRSFAVGADLGQELARRLGVPFVPVPAANALAAVDAVRAGQVDAVL